jgi:7,8-dihydropterin-6-yl-methyl-4-(beta-D-ribofuranosyl)aminobenzene 5'-phosphate synthase
VIEDVVAADPELGRLLELMGNPDLDREFEKFNVAREATDQEWLDQQAALRPISELGATARLEILPLIEFYTADPSLEGEAGVSYLVTTDQASILFDVGLNQDSLGVGPPPELPHPSRLLRNMARLGVTLDDIDTIVISHDHADHTGGTTWASRGTFSPSGRQPDLAGRRIFTPVPMTDPGAEPTGTPDPTVLARGVATTGTIPAALFFSGRVVEQALLVNVSGKGVVLIVGCGHQTLKRLLDRTEKLVGAPLYGIVGGLHYPVTQSRAYVEGIGLHQRFGTGKPPWQLLTMEEVDANVRLLAERQPKLVAISAHDSCDAAIAAFRAGFPGSYRELRVGDRIVVS